VISCDKWYSRNRICVLTAVSSKKRWKMSVSYKKLWKLLIDKEMTKVELREKAGISTGTLAKLGKNENVTTDVLVKVCEALDCDISDIMEMEKHEEEV
jgi:hypothetical protein